MIMMPAQRHICVVDSANFLAGIMTRKDLMSYQLGDAIKVRKVQSLIRGWVTRYRYTHGRDLFDGTPLVVQYLSACRGSGVWRENLAGLCIR
jgi:hypothetical protein